MSEDDEGAARRGLCHVEFRDRADARLDPCRAKRHLISARIDEDAAHGEMLEEIGEGPAHMAGAENIDMGAAFGRLLSTKTGGAPVRSTHAPKRDLDTPCARSSAARLSEARMRVRRRSTRPPQHWPISGPSGRSMTRLSCPSSSIRRAASMARNSNWPPPIVPQEAVAATNISVPASRGDEPRTLVSATEITRRFTVRNRESPTAGPAIAQARPSRRDTAMRTRSGVAGASRRGQWR